MTISKGFIAVTVSTLLVAGCAGMGVSTEERQQRYQQAMAEAEASYKKALSVNYAWINSTDLMKAAKEAAGKGELEKAINLAEQSRQMSELAYKQYQDQKNVGERGIR